jgi:hypothetical protein
LGGKYLFLNELLVERTALDKQFRPTNVLPQSNIFFSQILRIDAPHHETHPCTASLALAVCNDKDAAMFDTGANARNKGSGANIVIMLRH